MPTSFASRRRSKRKFYGVIEFTLLILRSFGFEQFEIFLSTRPEKYVGRREDWQRAKGALRRAIQKKRTCPYSVDEGGGAFYGPKIDVKIKDAIGRSWQCSTIQFDFNLPERFDMSFIAEDGKAHRPYMVHRALLGSMERFFGVLDRTLCRSISVLAGTGTGGLAAHQRKAHCQAVRASGIQAGGRRLRAKSDLRNEKINLKIRQAQLEKIPYMVVIGDKEVENGMLSVRNRFDGDMGTFSFEKFLELIQDLRL